LNYNPQEIEPKWQKFWEENKTFQVKDFEDKPKYYLLDMFPYPSGDGLHVGHVEGYTATDIIARYKRMCGFNVLHPMGWDAFGLPAENYAIKTGVHPRIATQKNINRFRVQLKQFGFSYDWDREVDTTDPKYYKWTQWIFRELYKKGLAYESLSPINWCPSCKTGLANEEVVNGECDRCGSKVSRKNLRQWMLKITAYAERLLHDLDKLDWPENVKEMQRNWIGKSEGALVTFSLNNSKEKIEVFTTRPDTLFGATYMVLSPEHPLVEKICTDDRKELVIEYCQKSSMKSDLDRTDLNKEKTGAFTGAFALNPVNNQAIPVWIADYVLTGYGTGAIMAVPAHDERDHEFAKKYNLKIIEVVKGGKNVQEEAFVGDGAAVNSPLIDGLATTEAKEKITKWLEEKNLGKATIQYKLRDWVFSRQRYWGEPFPLLHGQDGSIQPVEENDLPVELPNVESYQPTGTGESPLAGIDAWVNVTDKKTGKKMKREVNTMPQWAGSCWYYLRFIDPGNGKQGWDPQKEKYWMPVDLYVGGVEHAVLHLLYARFWHKVLYDLGKVSTPEPFRRLVNQGLILGADGEKMSKSRGNVVNPDAVVEQYGADAVRMYEMFLGPLERVKPWNTQGIEGLNRFLQRVWRLVKSENPKVADCEIQKETLQLMHQTIIKVTDDLDALNFNTAISQLMILCNHFYEIDKVPQKGMDNFVLMLAPFAPHMAEELWECLGHKNTLSFEPWPKADKEIAKTESVTVVVQINGKVRSKLNMNLNLPDSIVIEQVLSDGKVKLYLEGKKIIKQVVVPNKLVSLVVEG
jgi:leucyl-tRNA synthetase